MELEILPGPSLAELARTAMARAAAATVSEARPDAPSGIRMDCPDGSAPGDRGDRVPVRDRADGSPLLLAAAGSMLEQRLTSCPDAVTVSVPASVPFAALVLRHLEHRHMAELTGCVRAHGLVRADWVVPRGLDRYGLELFVLTMDGTAAVRLSFPDGPVSSLDEVPDSIRAVLTCCCGSRREAGREAGPNRPCEPS